MVTVGDHGAAAVPAFFSDDVHAGGEKSVGVAHHGADVQVVFPVFYGHVKVVTILIEFFHYGFSAPVTKAVNNVAAVALG